MKSYGWLFNLLTVFVLGLTALFCLWSGLTFANPQFVLNPLKPPVGDDLPLVLPTPAPFSSPTSLATLPPAPTATPLSASPTSTAADTATLAATSIPESPTVTPFPSPVGPTATLAPTDLPSRTPTVQPPPQTATSDFYPGGVTPVPPDITDTPKPYS
jgi:hypothetical protein